MSEYKDEQSKSIERKENRTMLFTSIICMLVVCVFVVCGMFSGGLVDNKMAKILEKNGYTDASYKVVKTINLPSGSKGLPSGNENKLALINSNGYYGYAVINTEYESVTVPVYGFIPLNVVQQQIWRMDEEINVTCFDIFSKYMVQYGVDCMETKRYAESFLRELTDKGVISLDKARNAISNSTMKIFPKIKSNNEVVVIFEKNTAVPTYYTTKSTQMIYNWSSLWPEYQYEFVQSSLDSNTLSSISYMYGPPYVQKTVWAVVDSNLNEVGTYDSLEDVKKKYQK